MRVVNWLFILIFIPLAPLNAQQAYRTDVMDKLVKTLQIRANGKSATVPCISLYGKEFVEINFDMLHDGYRPLSYSIIHCDADWKQSELSPIEYMAGFQGMPLEDFANSMATTTQYANYIFRLPNEDIRFKVSGNYAVRVYDEDHPQKTLLTACFSVYEPQVSIAASLSSNTLIDTNQSHQEVSFMIDHSRFPITFPETDLKIRVIQNGRQDNAVTGLLPTTLLSSQVIYKNNRNLIFEAGNEYRRMEFLTTRYNGMHVDRISFHNPYYHVELMTDLVRRNMTYQYDQDQNGRYLIRCVGCTDANTDADYNIVHFTLQSALIPDGDLYLLGDIYNNVLDEKSKMGYNTTTGRYEKSVQLKQGHYNYMYVFVPNGETRGTTRITEGNYYQTENEYDILVYYRPMNTRYDRLIGIQHITNRVNHGQQ